jgi:phosphomannomutase
MTHSFDPTILREYDIRGIVGHTLSEEDAYALGRTFASEAHDQGAKRLAVGRDGREHSPRLEEALVRGLTAGGLDVVRVGQGPSPMLYWAVSELDVDGGIQITGSHNPADYNGFKMLLPGGSVFGSAIRALGTRAAEGRWHEGEGKDRGRRYHRSLRRARLVEDFRGGAYRIGWDAGNGAAGPAPRSSSSICRASTTPSSPRSTAASPTTPRSHGRNRTSSTKALVLDKGLDFGIAFDGRWRPHRRGGQQGRVIWGDQLL